MSDVVLLDATTLISLGSIGELELLTKFEGRLLVPESVAGELTTEPARTNLDRLLGNDEVTLLHTPGDHATLTTALKVLDADTEHGDVELLAGVLSFEAETTVGVVSDDRRIRTITEGLGATVTGTIGVVVSAVHEGLSESEGKKLIRRIDGRGLHTTGELRETAYELVEAVAENR